MVDGCAGVESEEEAVFARVCDPSLVVDDRADGCDGGLVDATLTVLPWAV